MGKTATLCGYASYYAAQPGPVEKAAFLAIRFWDTTTLTDGHGLTDRSIEFFPKRPRPVLTVVYLVP